MLSQSDSDISSLAYTNDFSPNLLIFRRSGPGNAARSRRRHLGRRCCDLTSSPRFSIPKMIESKPFWVDFDPILFRYAVLFGLVSGMMVYISFRELLRTAHNYDPADNYTTVTLFVGMAVMAASLSLFVGG